MLGLGAATRIFVATGATDMRLSFNGLYSLVVGQLKQDPKSGHLFLFANKRRDRMKILFFDNFSLWVCARRMEKGRLHWPSSACQHALRIAPLSRTQNCPLRTKTSIAFDPGTSIC